MSSFAEAVGLSPDQTLDDTFAQAFNALFTPTDAAINRDRIALDLGKLVAFVSRGISIADRRDTADFQAAVYEHALSLLPKYCRKPRKKGVPAFDWFRKVINRKFWEVTRRDLMVRRRSQSIEAVDDTGDAAAPVDHMAAVRANKQQRSFRLRHPADIHTAARLIDLKISKLVRAYSMTTDEIQLHTCRSNVLALQDLRFELLGAFKRVLTEGVEYTRTRRNHHMPTPVRRGRIKPTAADTELLMKREIPLWTLPN
jgi:hypothetical protein